MELEKHSRPKGGGRRGRGLEGWGVERYDYLYPGTKRMGETAATVSGFEFRNEDGGGEAVR